MEGNTQKAGNGKGKGGGKGNAPEVKTQTGTEGAATGNEGAPAAGTEGEGTEGDGKPGTEVVVTGNGNGTEGAPAAKAAARKKTPPLKNGTRKGGTRTAGSGEPTYNIAICAYNELVIDPKTKEFKFLPYIANGVWDPTWNGDPRFAVDETVPKFATIELALAAGAIQFGMSCASDKDMVQLYKYVQNIKLAKGGFPLTGKVHETGEDAGKPVSYSCFLTATAPNAKKVYENLKAYLDSPYKTGVMFELLPQPFNLTYPQVAPATLTLEPAADEVK